MALRTMLEKGTDADVLREMIGFAAQRLMDLEVQGLTGAAHGERSAERLTQRSATVIGIATGRPAPGPSSSGSRSCARAATSRRSWSRAAWRRRR